MKPVLLTDFGSTYTKLTAVDLDAARILGTAQSYTTVAEDVRIGFQKALDALLAQTGPLTFAQSFACSSAAGGLRMMASGLVPELTLEAVAAAVDPASPDYLWAPPDEPKPNLQLLVDTAFFAHALVRAPRRLIGGMTPELRKLTADLLIRSRVITPGPNNWLLFSAMVEAALRKMGFPADSTRMAYALRQHDQWFKGDGVYGDGRNFAFDYYNSFVIQPMMLDVVETIAGDAEEWELLRSRVLRRMRRYAAIQERLIAPDGSFPAVGRSIAYRCGAFQALAAIALRRELPEELHPSAVREALSAVIARTLDAPGTRDENGWLRIGLCGHQPGLGEVYISTGSLYLASTAFLPLGLPESDEFWSAPAEPWSSVKIWSGCDLPADHAVQDL